METSQIILNYLNAAAEQQTNNAKVAVLLEMFTDEDVSLWAREFVDYVLDPTFNFYQTTKTLPEPKISNNCGTCTYNIHGLLMILGMLAYRIVTGQEQEERIADFLYCADDATIELFKMAIARQLPGKIGRTLVNKAFPELIFKQPYPGVRPWDADAAARLLPWDRYVLWQKKIDGMAIFWNTTTQTYRTRQGQDVTSRLAPLLGPMQTAWPRGYVVFMEMCLYDPSEWTLMPRPEANGHFNALFKGERKINSEQIHLTILDMIPEAEFYGKEAAVETTAWRLESINGPLERYNERQLNNAAGFKFNFPTVCVVPTEKVHSIEEARVLTQTVISQGGEGGILKDPSAPYKNGKSGFKMKNEFECTLLCIGTKPHKKNPDWVGSLRCVSDDNEIDTYVGSGLNEIPGHDLDRTQGPDYFIGGLYEIRAEKISKKNALDLPRVVELRTDKGRADTGQEVVQAYNDSTSLVSK
jgi:hypothetical protein